MSRPRGRPSAGYSRMRHVRLRLEEDAGLVALGQALGLPPSRLIRCLIREAITGGPDFFDNGEVELRTMRQHLTAIGRNLNQLTRAVHRGEAVEIAELRRVINAARLQVAAVEELHLQTIETAAKRAWWPLYRAVGLLPPFDPAAQPHAAHGGPARPPGPGSGRAERKAAGAPDE